MNKRNHKLGCRCSRCVANGLGNWIDRLGAETEAGEWQVFQTISFRTSPGSGIPSPEFGRHCFQDFVFRLGKDWISSWQTSTAV